MSHGGREEGIPAVEGILSWPKEVVLRRARRGMCRRKRGINRDNSRLGAFEMTAIRNASLIRLVLRSLPRVHARRARGRRARRRRNLARTGIMHPRGEPTRRLIAFTPLFAARDLPPSGDTAARVAPVISLACAGGNSKTPIKMPPFGDR